MKESMVYENAQVESGKSEKSAGGNGSSTARTSTVTALKAIASRLMREVESLNEVQTVDIHQGIDFYDQVTEFEIGLIRRALTYTHGHQGRAARLLNLKVTTLNSKIKQYKIKLDVFASGYPMMDAADFEMQQHI